MRKLAFYDFDSTLVESPHPEYGIDDWQEYYGEEYPHIGWWSKPESLDLNVFEFRTIPKMKQLIKKDLSNPTTYVIVLTARIESLRPYIERILKKLSFDVDILDMKSDGRNKGEKVLEYIMNNPNIKQVDVYDDNYEREILSYKSIVDEIPDGIDFNIYHVSNGMPTKLSENQIKIKSLVNETIVQYLQNGK